MTFFRKFFSKGSSLHFFDILQQNGRSKNSKGPPLHFSALCDLLETSKKFRKKFGTIFSHFFSLFRHSATSFRKKISAKVPPSFFLEFCGRMDVEKYQKAPLSVFFGIETFFQFCFSPKGPPFNFLMICDRRDEKCLSVPLARQSGPTFRFLGCFRREYFDTLKSFCYF